MSWYTGPTLMEFLDGIEIDAGRLSRKPFRLCVEAMSGDPPHRSATGTIASGVVQQGDAVRIQPAGRMSRVVQIVGGQGVLERAAAGDSVSLLLENEADLTRGDLIVRPDEPAEVADQFEASLVWLDEAPLLPGRSYAIEIGSTLTAATVTRLKYEINVNSLEQVAAQKLEQDAIGVCNLQLDRPVAFDPYRKNSRTGGLRLIEPSSGATLAIGMLHFALRRAQNVQWQAIDVNRAARAALMRQQPCVLWYTGLSGAGKSTIANLVDKKLHSLKRHGYLLDGDNVRHGLNKDLGFTAADRVENIRRIAEVAKLMVDAGLIVGTAFISPFRAERRMARALLGPDEFIEIFVDTPLSVAEARDPKGLYKKARRGELKNFTGIDSPYEVPENPELRLDTTLTSAEAAAELVLTFLDARGIFRP
jgi:bifunctional enzyme CysN/CysC